MAFDQGEFDFGASGSDEGYRNWQKRLDEKKRAFERRWGIVVGRRVRVTLHDHDRPFEGEIYLATDGVSDSCSAEEIRLRIGGFEFTRAEIAGIVRLGGMMPSKRGECDEDDHAEADDQCVGLEVAGLEAAEEQAAALGDAGRASDDEAVDE